ncbi:MAG: hypothetical protein QM708_12070 [Propioniciclava sp.]|uniref:hypothetical protein n=1 Tax=Propioniciclava sp. TaxID=2038686 RepID=UPI0039E67BE0
MGTRFLWRQPYAAARFAPGVLAVLDDLAQRKAAQCGEGYEAKPAHQGTFGGGRVIVLTVTRRAMVAEAKYHNLARP